MGFVKINNKKNFLIDKVPVLHPDSIDYERYWRTHKKRCIEGFWGIDDANIQENIDWDTKRDKETKFYRWMPPNLYFYANFGKIRHNDPTAPPSAPKVFMRPYLRDVEWEFFYNWAEAQGFSGFEDDEEYSCYKDLPKYKQQKESGEIITVWIPESCKRKDGSLKEYTPARQYIRRTFEKQLGRPLWENQAKNLFMLGARGFGKSYMVGVGIILYGLLFDGAKYYTEESRRNPAKVEVFVGAAISDKSSELLFKAKDSLERLDGDWGENDNYVPPPFFKNTSGSLQPNNAKNPWRHEYEEKVPGKGWVKRGSGTNIKHGIYTTENPEAAVGTRPQVMVIEEVGLLSNVLQVHAANENCQTEGTMKIGSSIYLGTGGNMEKIRESESIFRNPSQYQFLEFDDEWEGRGKIGWFVPAEYSLNQFKDENGNTDFDRAAKWLDEQREHKRKAASSTAIDNELMYRPRVPSEMFLSKRGNIFPINELRNRLTEIKINNRFLDMSTPVMLSFDKTAPSGISHRINHDGRPIHDFPINSSENNRDGCVVIYEFPITDESGQVPKGLYNIGHDPYAKDDPSGESLGSVYVMKTSKHPSFGYNEIVAEYVGRPYEGRHIINENIEKLAMFYGNSPGMIFFENARGNVKEYFEKRKKLYLLATQPRTILTKTPGVTNRTIAYGYPMDNRYVKAEAVKYARDWLLMEREEDGKIITNIDKIWSKGLLEELISFSMDEGNFDRVMAFLGCVIGLEETTNRYLREEEGRNGNILDFLENNPRLFPNKRHELNGQDYVETN